MKKSELIRNLLFSFLIPIIASVTIYFLTYFLPDSFHIITSILLNYFFAEISCVFFLFLEGKKYFRYFARFFLLISICTNIYLNFYVFYIFHISRILSIFLISFYFSIALVICIFTKKQKISVYLWIFVAILISGFFNYISTINLIYSHRLYSIFLFLASAIIIALIFYYMIDLKKYHFKHSKVVRFILLITSQVLLSLSAFFMIN